MGAFKDSRFHTIQLLSMVDNGVVDKDYLIQDLLGYLSEAEVEDFMRTNDYMREEEDECA